MYAFSYKETAASSAARENEEPVLRWKACSDEARRSDQQALFAFVLLICCSSLL